MFLCVEENLCDVWLLNFFELQLSAYFFLSFHIKFHSNMFCSVTNSIQIHTHELNSEFQECRRLHLINFHNPHFLSPLAHLLFINVKFWWKSNRTLNCFMYVWITNRSTMDYSICRQGDGEEQKQTKKKKVGVCFWEEGWISKNLRHVFMEDAFSIVDIFASPISLCVLWLSLLVGRWTDDVSTQHV